jgi:hypothetical protein
VADELERVADSLESLYGSGGISEESAEALAAVNPRELASGLGEVSSSSELLLATILVDDSTSISTSIDEIRHGYSVMLEALRDESFSADVQVHARAMNQGVISPYRKLSDSPPLTDRNYRGSDLAPQTPLYLQTLLTLGTVVTKAQEEEARGAKVRTFTLIITDGGDNDSGDMRADHARAVVTDMLEFATNHIVAGMGVGENQFVDFRDIFISMGIPGRWILTAGTSADELRLRFRQIAKILSLAASSEAGFRQLAAGSLSD